MVLSIDLRRQCNSQHFVRHGIALQAKPGATATDVVPKLPMRTIRIVP